MDGEYDSIETVIDLEEGIIVESTVTDEEQLPDTDTTKETVTISLDDLKNGYTFEQKMYPHETRGKFAGHTAEFTAEYKVELQDGYKIEDFQKNTTTRSLPDKPEKPTKPVLAQIHWYQLLGYSRKALIIFILGIAFIIGTTIKT